MLLLVVAASTAIAAAALPSATYAKEYIADCETGLECSAPVSGGAAVLSNTSNETISCTATSGSVGQVSGTSTGTAALTFTGCKETVSIFKFQCHSPGAEAGKLVTNALTSHLVNLEEAATVPGVLLTGVNMTTECSGALGKWTVTGSLLGKIEEPSCESFASSHKIEFTQVSEGHQTFKQASGTGTVYDLTQNNDAGGAYVTASATGTGTVTYGSGNKLKITCSEEPPADEYIADCEAELACSATVSGGAAVLSNTSSETISCTATSGTITQTSESSTGTTQLTFTGCKETVSIFKFQCHSPGAEAGKLVTNALTSHLVDLDEAATVPGVLLTGVNMTTECSGALGKRTVTGNLMGKIEEPSCGSFASSHKIEFTQTSEGHQTYKQVTGTGTVYDLTQNNDGAGPYVTASVTGTGTLTYSGGRKLKITC
jgi:hypothetical protein